MFRELVDARANMNTATNHDSRWLFPSRLAEQSMTPEPVPALVPLPRERTKRPYSTGEICAYLALADAQPTPARANRASALICLGAGAGIVRAELRELRGKDVIERSGGVVAVVAGPRRRVVPVIARYGCRLLANAAFAGEGLLISGGSTNRRNLSTPVTSSLAGGKDLARLEQGRLRATWLAEVARLIGLRAFMEAAGVDVSQRLGDIAALLPAPDEAEAVAALGGRRC